MSNMSYCRFYNTVRDLEDCYDALIDHDPISKEELPYAQRLLDLCADIIDGDFDPVSEE